MSNLERNIADLLAFLTVILFFQLTFGFVCGLAAGTAWNEHNTRGKELCGWAREKPHSYFAYGFYPLKCGQRAGCFLIEPKLNYNNSN